MTELDFDELDKAVNNLMKEATGSEEDISSSEQATPKAEIDSGSNNPVIAPVSIDSSPSNRPMDSGSSSLEARPLLRTDILATPAVRPDAASLATKRRGRFMDVVHPSSDMKTTQTPRRVGATLQPMAPDIRPMDHSAPIAASRDEDIATIPDARDNEQPAIAQAPASADEDAQPLDTSHLDAPKNDYPDPIALQMEREQTGGDDAAVSSDVPVNIESTDEPSHDDGVAIDISSQSAEVEEVPIVRNEASEAFEVGRVGENEASDMPLTDERPLTSPFLPNAKVEKRPLGNASYDEVPHNVDSASHAELPTQSESEAADDQIIAEQQEEVAIPLPAELSGAVMVVEGTNVPHADTAETRESNEPQPSGSQEPVATNGAGSIPPQYKEQPSSSPSANGAIYDTQTYHHPLAHPAKKKSGLGVVIWILVLLIIGALAGAAYFYFKLR